jgi:hypothetical protein
LNSKIPKLKEIVNGLNKDWNKDLLKEINNIFVYSDYSVYREIDKSFKLKILSFSSSIYPRDSRLTELHNIDTIIMIEEKKEQKNRSPLFENEYKDPKIIVTKFWKRNDIW